MGARHETEVLISPTIKSERGKLYSGLPPVYLCGMAARLEGAGWARKGRAISSKFVPKAVQWTYLALTWLGRKLGRQRGGPGSARFLRLCG